MNDPLLDPQTQILRAVLPAGQRMWKYERLDEGGRLQIRLGQWLEDVSEVEALFKKHVYETDDLRETDLRQHRLFLYALLHDGEALCLSYIDFGNRSGKPDEIAPSLNMIDQKLKALFGSLMAWHGPISAQDDLPDSLKQAFRELDEGKLVDFELPKD